MSTVLPLGPKSSVCSCTPCPLMMPSTSGPGSAHSLLCPHPTALEFSRLLSCWPSSSSISIEDLGFQNCSSMDSVPHAGVRHCLLQTPTVTAVGASCLPAARQPQGQALQSPCFSGPQKVGRVLEALLQESAGTSRPLTRVSHGCLYEARGSSEFQGEGGVRGGELRAMAGAWPKPEMGSEGGRQRRQGAALPANGGH